MRYLILLISFPLYADGNHIRYSVDPLNVPYIMTEKFTTNISTINLYKGIATSNALSSLKFDHHKGMYMACGVGGYENEVGYACGVSYKLEDGPLIYGGIGDRGAYNASFSLRLK